MRPIAIQPHREVGQHMAQLRAALAQPRDTRRERKNAVAPRVDADDRTLQRAILGNAADDRFDVAGVQRRRVAHEKIVDGEPIFQRLEVHRDYSAASRRAFLRSISACTAAPAWPVNSA